ncbi:spore coat protein [Pseudalkalibacillus decolorationis]|uniref:spore coat protein n=1 Tax=Pseudalkalibacillus decolorationis TaxID=163879 RepID=UPI002148F9B4|nr:spore coat protein [Pseudalkalibacillus decolorationis]
MSSFFNDYKDCDVREDKKRCDVCCNNGFNALSGRGGVFDGDATIEAELNQLASAKQVSEECITIKDSCDISVKRESDQSLILVQVAAQVLIAALTAVIAVDDPFDDEEVLAELTQIFKSKQVARTKICIENSRGVKVESDTDQNIIAVQIAAQVLIAAITFVIVIA